MATFSKDKLSGSTGGKGILVAATATAGTLIHLPPISGTFTDEIWLYAVNTSASDVKLTIEYGGATAPNDHIEYTVKAENGLYLIVPGLVLFNTDPGNVVRAFAATANVIVIHGYVNHIAS